MDTASPTVSPDFSRNGYVEDAAAVLEHLGIHGAVVLGHSLGGVNAYQLAARLPGLVDALIVEDVGAEVDDDLSFSLSWPHRAPTRAKLLEKRQPQHGGTAPPYPAHRTPRRTHHPRDRPSGVRRSRQRVPRSAVHLPRMRDSAGAPQSQTTKLESEPVLALTQLLWCGAVAWHGPACARGNRRLSALRRVERMGT
nr:alpha/beta hydrolase [Streptomyces sp. NBC_00998]